jgi:hypothetical protein
MKMEQFNSVTTSQDLPKLFHGTNLIFINFIFKLKIGYPSSQK